MACADDEDHVFGTGGLCYFRIRAPDPCGRRDSTSRAGAYVAKPRAPISRFCEISPLSGLISGFCTTEARFAALSTAAPPPGRRPATGRERPPPCIEVDAPRTGPEIAGFLGPCHNLSQIDLDL
jgi:hypothetical protein